MSEGDRRRAQILEILKESEQPVSGTELAGKLHVSRQVIVQDVALLRAENKEIMSTYKGYVLPSVDKQSGCVRVFRVNHTTEETLDELQTMVDYGGKVLDVFVEHPLYGQIRADLLIENRLEAMQFVKQLKETAAHPLNVLTDGYHYHTVVAPSEEHLDLLEVELRKKHYLQL